MNKNKLPKGSIWLITASSMLAMAALGGAVLFIWLILSIKL
ncbi:MAG: hypothetical protein PF447_09570 [Spirochaetaceae bacterium]|jgi:membrane protein implicated in regulation of membrane protease activity|nr:hypothetical protein [Spirochaetaceae bacterium]